MEMAIIPSGNSKQYRSLSTPYRDLFTKKISFESPNKVMQSKWTTGKTKTFMELVAPGYVAEEHTVVTADEYILTVHRIRGSFWSPINKQKKPVVLFLHGMMAASDVWILRGPNEDLVYSLVDNGYDVWALNARGNYYSKRHRKLPTNDPRFWQFSWHEIAVYDVPATVDYILELTGQSKLSLIGHSMGGTVELVFLSELSEYNEKLNVAIAWAPVSLITHDVPGLINNFVFRYGNQLGKIFELLNVHEIFLRNLSTDNDIINKWLKFCNEPHIRKVCVKLYEYIFGVNDLEELDFSLLERARRHYPQGTSVQTLSHYRQIIVSRQFRRYDYGSIGNKLKYGSFVNSAYSLYKISAPFVIYYGLDDPLSTPKDIQALLNEIRHGVAKQIPYCKFGHLDFLLLNQTKYLYDNVIQEIKEYKIFKLLQTKITIINIMKFYNFLSLLPIKSSTSL
ncbi:hypothetical protein PV327_006439 [Microctonus hyperodae]|uniref:AB hydrolase-1 domain-containing protein n=1 Tax=Microctonus hyperodae TaxID=165561 RepID=A0AA39KI87_MICHY|nr:hypothetical protein PV327_006439 [Microctonus hyperodae]